MNRISLTIESRLENVAIVSACAKALAGVCFSSDVFAEIDNALAETVNNCIEHAYCGVENRPIIIHFALADDFLAIKIIDFSEIGIDPARLKNLDDDFDYDPMDISQLPEGGFGLKIIKSCVDEFSYKREGNQNHWFLKKLRH